MACLKSCKMAVLSVVKNVTLVVYWAEIGVTIDCLHNQRAFGVCESVEQSLAAIDD